MAAQANKKSRVAIIGGGLQGCATAYYLNQQGFEGDITLIERTGIACAASGKGGGFLARNWGSGPTRALHELSFDLHAELAQTLDIQSYRPISTLQVQSELGLREWPPKPKTSKPIKRSPLHPSWLDSTDTLAKLMDHKTAQVVPAELCAKLFEHSGAQLIVGAARGLELDDDTGRCSGVRLDDRVIACDEVIVCMGAWSVLLEDWLPVRVPLEGIYSSSIVYEGTDSVKQEPRALFCAEDSQSCHLEVYPRFDGSVYLCGLGGSDHVSGSRLREGGDLQDATMMSANPLRVEAAKASFSKIAPHFAGQEPKLAQACMRPCSPDALPLLGRFSPDSGLPTNVIVATGHNCWVRMFLLRRHHRKIAQGILWAPITGKLVADLVLDRPSSVNLSAFAPDRFVRAAAGPGKQKRRGRATADAQSVGEQW